MADLADVGLALLDLDGTVYIGTRPVLGAVAAVARLRDRGVGVRFVTNTDSISTWRLHPRCGAPGRPLLLQRPQPVIDLISIPGNTGQSITRLHQYRGRHSQEEEE